MADTFKFVQAQNFSLAGSGAIIGATSIILKSFAGIDGTLLTMTDFGSLGFGTLEPGNGTLEEQISFTGVVQNSNGTATLTGVSSVLFIAPYTQTSGLLKTHAGSTTFVISNTSGFYDELSGKNNDETVTGKWTFPSADPNRAGIGSDVDTAEATAFVTLGQLSRQAISGASNASTTVKGIVELSTQSEADAKSTTGGTGALLVNTPDLARSTLLSDYVIDTGAADAYVITPVPAISAYTTGQIFTFKSIHTNTTVSTLNVNGKGAIAIKKGDGTVALQAGDITSGQIIQVEYDGTNFQMTSHSSFILPPISSSNINEFIGTTNGTSFSFQRPFDYQLFTSSGTWTKPTNLSGNEMVKIQLWGGGGAGGGSGTGAGNVDAGGGGGGAYNELTVRASDLTSTVTVTIGAGGTGVAQAAGNVGGDSTFGSYLTAYGGGGGHGANAAETGGGGGGGGTLSAGATGTNTTVGANGSPTGGVQLFGGGAGGTANAGLSSTYGGGGGGAFNNSNTGAGGTSYYGGTGGNGPGTAQGGVGTAPGGGGGGTSRLVSTAGGAGARGECRVWVTL